MFSLISAWTNGWVNNRDAGDLRRHRVHYDVTVMTLYFHILWLLHFFRLFWQIFWRNCYHWLYRNLSMPWFWNLCRNFAFWQLPVHPAVKLWLKWRQFICVVQLYYTTFMWWLRDCFFVGYISLNGILFPLWSTYGYIISETMVGQWLAFQPDHGAVDDIYQSYRKPDPIFDVMVYSRP